MDNLNATITAIMTDINEPSADARVFHNDGGAILLWWNGESNRVVEFNQEGRILASGALA